MEKSKKIPGTDILVLEEFIASSDDDMEIHASVAAGFDTRKNLVVRLKYTDYDFRKNSYTQSAVIDEEEAWQLSKTLGTRLTNIPKLLSEKFGDQTSTQSLPSDVEDIFKDILDFIIDSGGHYKIKKD